MNYLQIAHDTLALIGAGTVLWLCAAVVIAWIRSHRQPPKPRPGAEPQSGQMPRTPWLIDVAPRSASGYDGPRIEASSWGRWERNEQDTLLDRQPEPELTPYQMSKLRTLKKHALEIYGDADRGDESDRGGAA